MDRDGSQKQNKVGHESITRAEIENENEGKRDRYKCEKRELEKYSVGFRLTEINVKCLTEWN